MWNFKFGAKSDGYLRSDPLRCLLITGYQANINQISSEYQPDIKNAAGFKMALRHFCVFLFVSVCFCKFLLFLYAFVVSICFSVYGRITFPAFVSFSAMVYIFVTVPTAGSFSP